MHLLTSFLCVKRYLEAFRQKEIPKPEACPTCDGKVLHWHGEYVRAVDLRDTGGLKRYDVPIRVVKCTSPPCTKRYHALLPAFVYPYRQMGPEVIEETLHRLVTDPTATTGSFDGEGIRPRRVNSWMRWLDRAIPAADLSKQIADRSPGGPLGSPPLVQVAPRRGAWQGPIPALWERIAERLSLLHRLHAAGHKVEPDPDPSALRSYLRHLWRQRKLILPLAGLHPQ